MIYSQSLKKRQDFQNTYKKGTSKGNRYLVMYVLRKENAENRLGISVSKKVGNSVIRHRITRLIRESYRLNETKFSKGLDIIIVARPDCRGISFQEMEKAVLSGNPGALLVESAGAFVRGRHQSSDRIAV